MVAVRAAAVLALLLNADVVFALIVHICIEHLYKVTRVSAIGLAFFAGEPRGVEFKMALVPRLTGPLVFSLSQK